MNRSLPHAHTHFGAGSGGGELIQAGLDLPKALTRISLDDVPLGHNEWVATHSPNTKRITRLDDGTQSSAAFDKVAINGIGQVLTSECMHPPHSPAAPTSTSTSTSS